MTDDRARYLTNMEGLTHEVFGGDPEEIVLRVARVGEGARSLDELARDLREEADRYERMQAGGWRLVEPMRDGQGRCRKPAEPATGSPGAASSPPAQPPDSLQAVVEGAPDLLDAAARLRGAAEAYGRLHAEGRGLSDPVAEGRVALR